MVKLLKQQPLLLDNLSVSETAFSAYDPTDLAPLPLLVQTGYLTIKDARMAGRRRLYRLGYPNFEIEESFSTWLVEAFSELGLPDVSSALERMVAALNSGAVGEMLEQLKVFFAPGAVRHHPQAREILPDHLFYGV